MVLQKKTRLAGTKIGVDLRNLSHACAAKHSKSHMVLFEYLSFLSLCWVLLFRKGHCLPFGVLFDILPREEVPITYGGQRPQEEKDFFGYIRWQNYKEVTEGEEQ